MKKNFVKEVLERIVEIDQGADALLEEVKAVNAEREVRIKRKYRELELAIMKDVRVRVKDAFSQRVATAQEEEARIKSQSQAYLKKVHHYFENNKETLVKTLFDDIFKVEV